MPEEALAASCLSYGPARYSVGLCVRHAEVSELCVGAVLLTHRLQTPRCAACLAVTAAVATPWLRPSTPIARPVQTVSKVHP